MPPPRGCSCCYTVMRMMVWCRLIAAQSLRTVHVDSCGGRFRRVEEQVPTDRGKTGTVHTVYGHHVSVLSCLQ